jgi:regulator of protease activity HflC (stomatin/prohibitin superfamily)
MKGLIFFQLLAFGVLLLIFARRTGWERPHWRWWGLAMIACGLLLPRMWITVPPAQVAAMYDPLRGGIQEYDLREGWHLIPPWATVRYFSVRTQNYTMSGLEKEDAAVGHEDAITVQTSEGLGLSVDATVLFHITPGDANRLWRAVGPNYVAIVVRPMVREAARIVISQYPVMSVYSNASADRKGVAGVDFFPGKRQEVADRIQERIAGKLKEKGITLERFLLRNVDFTSPAFEKAIVDKQVAQQRVVTQQYEAQIQQVRARANIVRAEGDAEAIRLKAAALAIQPRIIQWEMVEKLPQDLEVVLLPDNAMPILNLSGNSPLTPAQPSRSPQPQAQPLTPGQ